MVQGDHHLALDKDGRGAYKAMRGWRRSRILPLSGTGSVCSPTGRLYSASRRVGRVLGDLLEGEAPATQLSGILACMSLRLVYCQEDREKVAAYHKAAKRHEKRPRLHLCADCRKQLREYNARWIQAWRERNVYLCKGCREALDKYRAEVRDADEALKKMRAARPARCAECEAKKARRQRA